MGSVRYINGRTRLTHWTNLDLPIDGNWLLFDRMKPKHRYVAYREQRVLAKSRKDIYRNIPVCGRLMMGVPIRDPKTPPYRIRQVRCADRGFGVTDIADCKCTARHVLDRQLVVPCLPDPI